tara:strand:- start:690 stop:1784 length:1095 start_codon:yes stop_codon:yes gene_type:complete
MAKFIHFTGIVEDRQDPHQAGRVRVRCLGFHSENKTALPTADLPWAQPLLPTTASGISGLGTSPTFLVNGTWVFGFFRDGETMQQPVVLGTLPGKPTEYSSRWYDKAFYDGQGIYPKYIGESDMNRLATNEIGYKDGLPYAKNPHLSLVIRDAVSISNVATADFVGSPETTAADDSEIKQSDTTTFSQPSNNAISTYPYNKVYETESGHIQEFDDTPTRERIHTRHKTGTSLEWLANGDQVNLIKKDNHQYTIGHDYHYIEGNSDITIDGRHKVYINKSGAENNHYDIQIGAKANINIQVDDGDVNLVTRTGKVNVNAGGDYNLKVGGNYTLTVDGSHAETIAGQRTETVTGDNTKTGKTINLN